MCGIAGIWNRAGEPVEPGALARMGTILAHRGPDGSGTHIAGEIGLVNRRLRILDLSTRADQPMELPEAGLWITFNGAIHNYIELRRELESSGARFRTTTDTEVVLHAYAIWGEDCFERFNGMWALALWDARARRLVLSRDRFGIKPLNYSVRGGRICFASEAKAILTAFPEEREPDLEEIERFLAGAYPDAGAATFFKNIKNVCPATTLVVSEHHERSATYWRFEPGNEERTPDAKEQFRELLVDAVRLRTRSDVPIGAALSGGLDSSAVVGLVDGPTDRPIQCFSLKYDDPTVDESRYSALAAANRGFPVHWVRPQSSELLDTMRKIVWHHDAPTPMRGRLGQWFLMRDAGRHVKVLLEGHGSDELLGGYSRDIVPYLIDLAREGVGKRRLAREMAELGHVEASRRWFLMTGIQSYRRDPRARGSRPYTSTLNNMLWDGLRHNGMPESLHSDDALSMAFSLESRMPFLDHRLVEFCFSLPFDEKIADGWTKSLLRRSLVEDVPAAILARRRKVGLPAPVVTWLRLPPNRRAVHELLLDPRALQRGYFDGKWLERSLTAFSFGPARYASTQILRVWRWITLELWFREFIDGAGPIRQLGVDPGSAEPFPRAHGECR